MHEISVVRSLIELVEEQLAADGSGAGSKASAVTVGIGPLAGVVPMAMQFAFDVATFGTRLEGCRLEIRTNSLVVWCDACGSEQEPRDINALKCPVCGTRTPRIVRGTELELLRIEVRDANAGRRGEPTTAGATADSGGPSEDSEEE